MHSKEFGSKISRVPTLHGIEPAYPGARFCTLVMQSKQSEAWLLGCSVSYVEAHEQSFFSLSRECFFKVSQSQRMGREGIGDRHCSVSENGIFAQSTRNALAQVTPNSRFLKDNAGMDRSLTFSSSREPQWKSRASATG